jgi:hypothetical protein
LAPRQNTYTLPELQSHSKRYEGLSESGSEESSDSDSDLEYHDEFTIGSEDDKLTDDELTDDELTDDELTELTDDELTDDELTDDGSTMGSEDSEDDESPEVELPDVQSPGIELTDESLPEVSELPELIPASKPRSKYEPRPTNRRRRFWPPKVLFE